MFGWLLKLRTSFAIHIRGTRTEFAPENIIVATGINEFKSSFRALLSPCISIFWRLAVDIYLAASRLGSFPPQATSASVNS